MNKKLMGLAVAATLGLASLTASADDMYRGAWYALPGLSYMHADSDLDAKSSGYGGFLSIGKELSESFDIQARGAYNTAQEDSTTATSGRYKQGTLGLDALYMFSRSNFRPFLLAGFGVSRSGLTYKNEPSLSGVGRGKTSPMGNLGLGLQYLFNDNLGLQADLREQWSKDIVPNSSGVVGSAKSATVGNTLLNLGGMYRFGAPEPVAAAPAPEPAPMPLAEPAPAPAPEPVAEPAPAPACQPTSEAITVDAEKLFGYDKASLQKGAKPILDGAVEKIKANPEITKVIVTGHTDRIGSDKYNQKLSERRAKIVADYLISQGVSSSLVTSEGKGESEPVVQCEGKKATKKLISCLQPNRRVVIRAEGMKEVGCK